MSIKVEYNIVDIGVGAGNMVNFFDPNKDVKMDNDFDAFLASISVAF